MSAPQPPVLPVETAALALQAIECVIACQWELRVIVSCCIALHRKMVVGVAMSESESESEYE